MTGSDASLPQRRGLGILLSRSVCVAYLEEGNEKATGPQVTECEVSVLVDNSSQGRGTLNKRRGTWRVNSFFMDGCCCIGDSLTPRQLI